MSNAPGIDQNELARVAALGTKKGGDEDPAGGDNALMELLMGAIKTFTSMVGKATSSDIANIANTSMTTGLNAGSELPGFANSSILKGPNISGGDGFFFKIFLALKKGGMKIEDLTKGIEPQQAVDVSWARLGEVPLPTGLPMDGGRGHDAGLA